jgi:hypothetical protein
MGRAVFRRKDQMKKLQLFVGRLARMGVEFEMHDCKDEDGNDAVEVICDKDGFYKKLSEEE